MSARFLLIDGYNLMHAAEMSRRRYGPGDLQRCRERLLRHLASHLSPAEIARTLVVFDAREPPPDRPSRLTIHGIQVLFANPGGDADVAIQESLAEHSAPRHVTLVSSDHVLQQAARRHQADSVDSEAFISSLSERRRRDETRRLTTPDEKPTDRLSAVEAEQWSQYFGDLSGLLAVEGESGQESSPRQSPDPDASPSTEVGAPSNPPAARQQRRPARRSSKPTRTKECPKGVGDLDFWMHVFRGLPEASELACGSPPSPEQLPDQELRLDHPKNGPPRRKRTD